MSVYPANLEANLLSFARQLRDLGFLISAEEVSLGLKALGRIDLADRQEVCLTLRAIFASTPRERDYFERLFALYFDGLLYDTEVSAESLGEMTEGLEGLTLLDWNEPAETTETAETMAYSQRESIAKSDFAQIHSDDVETLRQLVRRIAKRLATSSSRRSISSLKKAERIDLRRSLRRSLSHGGELFELSYKRRKLSKTRMIFVFDISGSMMVYSQFLLQLAYAFVRQRSIGKTEVFGFSTELYRLTPSLQRGGVSEAIQAARMAMPARSGGTKIGACLASLLTDYGQLIDRRSNLIIMSDGWDRGDLDLLQSTMRQLQERSHRLIWLNPLAASPDYQPSASGMRTALPYLDAFAPVHNTESFKQLEAYLV